MPWRDLSSPDFSKRIPISDSIACVELAREWDAVEAKPIELAPDVEKITSVVINGSGQLTIKDRRLLPHYVFHEDFDDHNPDFCNRILQDYSTTSRFWIKLFKAWTLYYPQETKVGDLVREALQENLDKLSPLQQSMSKNLKILKRHLDKNLLYKKIIVEKKSEWLEELGLKHNVATTCLVTAIAESIAGVLRSKQCNEEDILHFMSIVSSNMHIDGTLEAVALVGLVASLENHDVESELVKSVRSLVQECFPDPTIESTRWPSIPVSLGGDRVRDKCIDIAKRWRIFQSIDVFFTIIERTIDAPGAEHHFPERQKFWMKYFRQKKISEAWVVLSPAAVRYIKGLQARGDDEDIAGLTYGKINAAGRCILLMKVGDAIVMEWSHKGACRIWKSDDSRAPEFRRPEYIGHNIRSEYECDEENRITHDAHDNWKYNLPRVLKKCGGIRRVI